MNTFTITVSYHGEVKLQYEATTCPREGEWIQYGRLNFQVNSVVHNVSDAWPTSLHKQYLRFVECEAGRFFEEDVE